MGQTYYTSEEKIVRRQRLETKYGEAVFEDGRLLGAWWDKEYLNLDSSPDIGRWVDFAFFVHALHQRIVGRHHVIMESENTYIWVSFEKKANLDDLISYYAAVFEERYGHRPNVLLMNPGELCDLLPDAPRFLAVKKREIIPSGTFRIGYEEPKDAKETQPD